MTSPHQPTKKPTPPTPPRHQPATKADEGDARREDSVVADSVETRKANSDSNGADSLVAAVEAPGGAESGLVGLGAGKVGGGKLAEVGSPSPLSPNAAAT